MQERQERTLRAALSALVCTLVTATLHAAAGGGIPHPLGLALVAGVALCFALGGRRLTLAHLVLAIGATQGVLHAAFTFGGSAVGASGMAMPIAGSAGHDHAHGEAEAARALAAPPPRWRCPPTTTAPCCSRT